MAFGELFFQEAQGDPSKWDLAAAAYKEVIKYPPPTNKVYGYARSRKVIWAGFGALAFATFMNQTAGPEWRIGRARLNGYNGMTRIPSLSIDWFPKARSKTAGDIDTLLLDKTGTITEGRPTT